MQKGFKAYNIFTKVNHRYVVALVIIWILQFVKANSPSDRNIGTSRKIQENK